MDQKIPGPAELGGYVRSGGARDEVASALMKQAEQDGTCPFCGDLPNNKRVYPDDQFRYWRVMYNISPFEGAQQHILLILKRCMIDMLGLSVEELVEESQIVEALHRSFPGCRFATVTRSGDPRYNATTVRHLHTHAVAPRSTGAIDLWEASPRVPEFMDQLRQTGLPTRYVLRQLDLWRAQELRKAVPVRYSTVQENVPPQFENAFPFAPHLLGINKGMVGGAFRFVLVPLNGRFTDEYAANTLLEGMRKVRENYGAPSFGLVRYPAAQFPFAEMVVSRSFEVDDCQLDTSATVRGFYTGILEATPADFKPGKQNRELEFVDRMRQWLERYSWRSCDKPWIGSFKLSDQIAA